MERFLPPNQIVGRLTRISYSAGSQQQVPYRLFYTHESHLTVVLRLVRATNERLRKPFFHPPVHVDGHAFYSVVKSHRYLFSKMAPMQK